MALVTVPVGLNDHPAWVSSSLWNATIGDLAAAGCKVYRFDVPIGPYASPYVGWPWNVLDGSAVPAVHTLDSICRAHGVEAYPVFTYQSLTADQAGPFAASMAALVAQVPGLRFDWGNEPDGNGVDAGVYVTVAKAVVAACLEADPTCRPGLGVVSNVNIGGGGDSWWLKAAAAGVYDIDFSAIVFHSYRWYPTQSPTACWSGTGEQGVDQQFIDRRRAEGWAGAFRISECGYQSSSSDGVMTPALQAQYELAEIEALAALTPAPECIVAYEFSDGGSAGDDAYGWWEADRLTEKPIVNVMMAALIPPPPPPPPPPVPPPPTADEIATDKNMVRIDVAEARQAIAHGVSYYTWTGSRMVASRSAKIPATGPLFAFTADLAKFHIHHAGA